MLTTYQAEKFPHLEKSIKDGQWYAIKPDRPDLKEFIECIKLYIDLWHTLEFSNDYTAFRRVYQPGTLKWMAKHDKSASEKMVNEMHDKIEKGLDWKRNKR